MTQAEIQDWINEREDIGQRRPTWQIEGANRSPMADLYYYLIAVSWTRLLALSFAGFVAINLLFATLYYVGLEGVTNAQPGSFSDAFFFSVQTFSTIGFGAMSPSTPYTHILVTVESFAGLITVALATGLIFAKFARPKGAIEFSNKMLIYNRDGVPHLHFRMSNQRMSEVYNMKVRVSAVIQEVSAEGHQISRNLSLPQVREEVSFFTTNWLSMHCLDENSPLHGVTAENIAERVFVFIVTVEGLDATLMQTVQASYFYRAKDVLFDRHFQDMLTFDLERGIVLHQDRLNKTEPIVTSE
ncbi:MAG: ion channel [Chloroflexota bacterium]